MREDSKPAGIYQFRLKAMLQEIEKLTKEVNKLNGQPHTTLNKSLLLGTIRHHADMAHLEANILLALEQQSHDPNN